MGSNKIQVFDESVAFSISNSQVDLKSRQTLRNKTIWKKYHFLFMVMEIYPDIVLEKVLLEPMADLCI